MKKNITKKKWFSPVLPPCNFSLWYFQPMPNMFNIPGCHRGKKDVLKKDVLQGMYKLSQLPNVSNNQA